VEEFNNVPSYSCLWNLRKSSILHQFLKTFIVSEFVFIINEVIECCQRVSLSTAELCDKGEHRGGVLSFSCQPTQHHPHMFTEGTGEVGSREKLFRITVVFWCSTGNNLLKGDGKLIRVE